MHFLFSISEPILHLIQYGPSFPDLNCGFGRHQRCKTSAAVAQCAKFVETVYKVVDVQLSLPLLAPLGVGFTMVIWKNASLIFPRICFLAVFLYVLWFLNSVVQNTVLYLRRQVCFFLL